jgi:hypothetical protein
MTIGTYYGINYTSQYVTVPPTEIHASCQGKQVCMIDTREVDATTGLATCTLNFFKPPKGSRIVGGELWAEAMATNGTLSVGTSATTWARKAVSATVAFNSVDYTDKTSATAVVDKFLAATTLSSAAKTALLPIATIDSVGYEFDGDTIVTVTGATADMVDGARVTLMIRLIMP